MNPWGPLGSVTAQLSRWLWGYPAVGVEVIDASLQWHPVWPAGVLLMILIVSWMLIFALHRRRYESPLRAGLILCRSAILAIPFLMLMQPYIFARLARYEPQTIVLLLDHSTSMSIQDGPEANPISRWQRMLDALAATVDNLNESFGRDGNAPAAQPPRIKTYLFDEKLTPAKLDDLPRFEASTALRPTAIGNVLGQLRAELAMTPTAGVVMLTDGADNTTLPGNDPLRAAADLHYAGICVHTCLVGNERPRDLRISMSTDTPFTFVGDPALLNVSVEHQACSNKSTTIRLWDEERIIETRDIVLPTDNKPVIENFSVETDQRGPKRYRVEVTPLSGELMTGNNQAVAEVRVVDQPIRVLYIERWPRWQYRFLARALQRDPRFDAKVVLLAERDLLAPVEGETIPTTAEELADLDVVVLGDLTRRDLSDRQLQWIFEHVVNDGAGIVFIAGTQNMPEDFLDSPIAGLLPFESISTVAEHNLTSFQPVLTPHGLHHPLMRLVFGAQPETNWEQLPPLQWYAEVSELKPGAVVLVEKPAAPGGEPSPLVVMQRTGKGSSLFVATDETWKWRYRLGDKYFFAFWAHALGHVGMPHRVAGIKDRSAEPTEILSPGGGNPEIDNPSVNPELLGQIAELTSGEFIRLDQLDSLIDRLDSSPLCYRWSERISLWDRPVTLIAMVVLLTVEWIIRKRHYLP